MTESKDAEPGLPEATAVKLPDTETPPGEPPADAAPVRLLGSDLDGKTIKTLLAGVVVAVLMGASYPYMVLKLGFGPNVSVVAAFFGFLFLQLFDLGGTTHYNRWQNNLVEAAGTSAAQTAFMCVLLGAFDILRAQTHGEFTMTLTPLKSFLWLSCACTLGVLMAVPLRRHFIVDEKLPFVDGMAAAETLIVLDPPRAASAEVKRNAYAAFRAVMLGLALSALVMLFRDGREAAADHPGGLGRAGASARRARQDGGRGVARRVLATSRRRSYSLLSDRLGHDRRPAHQRQHDARRRARVGRRAVPARQATACRCTTRSPASTARPRTRSSTPTRRRAPRCCSG